MIVRNLILSSLLLVLVLSSCNSETDAESYPPEIFIKTPLNGFEVDVNDTLLLEPQIIYNYNTTYQWSLNGSLIPNSNYRTYKVIPNNLYGTFVYSLKVFNEIGADTMSFVVKSLVKIDFEDKNFLANSYSIGEPGSSVRSVKLLYLPVVNDTANNYWNGFALSSQYRTSQADSTIYQFSAYSSNGGDEASKVFLVYYEDLVFGASNFITFNDGLQHTIGNIAVTNNSYSWWIMKIGDSSPIAHQFVLPDSWFIARFSGYNEVGALVGTVDLHLADFTLGNSSYLLSKWATADLSTLGKISKLGINFLSSDVGENGINTPAYICIDNIRIID